MSTYRFSNRFEKAPFSDKVRHSFVLWLHSQIQKFASASVDIGQTINTLLRLSEEQDVKNFLLSRLGRQPEVFYFSQEYLTKLNDLYTTNHFEYTPPTSITTKEKRGKQKSRDLASQDRTERATYDCGCNCTLRDHLLIGNCTKCGRIACSAEGNTCFTCGNFIPGDVVASLSIPKDAPVLSQPDKDAKEYLSRLLHYQETFQKQTTVVDDAADEAFLFKKNNHEPQIYLDFTELI
ncbi:hypothetical protein RCL1_006668 [Eukaryota sp. TZLM3-RCL]